MRYLSGWHQCVTWGIASYERAQTSVLYSLASDVDNRPSLDRRWFRNRGEFGRVRARIRDRSIYVGGRTRGRNRLDRGRGHYLDAIGESGRRPDIRDHPATRGAFGIDSRVWDR